MKVLNGIDPTLWAILQYSIYCSFVNIRSTIAYIDREIHGPIAHSLSDFLDYAVSAYHEPYVSQSA